MGKHYDDFVDNFVFLYVLSLKVAQCYLAECLQFRRYLVDLLKNYATTLA